MAQTNETNTNTADFWAKQRGGYTPEAPEDVEAQAYDKAARDWHESKAAPAAPEAPEQHQKMSHEEIIEAMVPDTSMQGPVRAAGLAEELQRQGYHEEENSISNADPEPEHNPEDDLTDEQREFLDSLPPESRAGALQALQMMSNLPQQQEVRHVPESQTRANLKRTQSLLDNRHTAHVNQVRNNVVQSYDELKSAARDYNANDKHLAKLEKKYGVDEKSLSGMMYEDAQMRREVIAEQYPEFQQAIDNQIKLGKRYTNAVKDVGKNLSKAHQEGVDVDDIQKDFVDRYNKGEFDCQKHEHKPILEAIASKVQQMLSKLFNFCKRGLGMGVNKKGPEQQASSTPATGTPGMGK